MANSRALMQAQKRNSNADEQENYVDDGNNKVCQSSSAGNSINSYFIKLYFIFHQYSYAYSWIKVAIKYYIILTDNDHLEIIKIIGVVIITYYCHLTKHYVYVFKCYIHVKG